MNQDILSKKMPNFGTILSLLGLFLLVSLFAALLLSLVLVINYLDNEYIPWDYVFSKGVIPVVSVISVTLILIKTVWSVRANRTNQMLEVEMKDLPITMDYWGRVWDKSIPLKDRTKENTSYDFIKQNYKNRTGRRVTYKEAITQLMNETGISTQ